jgi:hypothetical protein
MGGENSKVIESSLTYLKKENLSGQAYIIHFFKLLLSDKEISLITHSEVRDIFLQRPENVLNVFNYLLDCFELFINNSIVFERWDVLCRIRIMTRIISVLNESPHEQFSYKLFWETWRKNKNMQIGKYLLSLIFNMFFMPRFTIEEKNRNKYKRYDEKEFEYIDWSLVWFANISFFLKCVL